MSLIGGLVNLLFFVRAERSDACGRRRLLVTPQRIRFQIIKLTAEVERSLDTGDHISLCIIVPGRVPLKPCPQMLFLEFMDRECSTIFAEVIEP